MSISKGMWVLVGLAVFGLLIGGQCGAPGPDNGDPDDNGDPGRPGDWDGGPTVTVYVVDQPAAGAAEFRELPDALAYLCAHLPDGESGVVVIRTERELPVETLTFSCPVSIEADPGIQPRIVGPGESPLVVNASGGLGLTGLSIANLGGVVVNASAGDLDIENNILPNGMTLNVGAVAATSKAARQLKDGGTADLKILSNRLGDGFKLNLAADLKAGSKCTLSSNDGNTCTLTGSGSVSGELAFKTNLFKVIDIDTRLKASAGLEVSGNQSLDSLKLNLNHTDSPKVTLSNNVTASAKISLLGQASATLNLTANDIKDGEIKFGVSDLKINALDGNYGRLALLATAIVASPILHYTETGSKIDGTFSFTALEAGTENANITVNLNNVDAKSNFQVDIKCKAKFVLSEGTAIRGSASVKVDGNVYEMEEAKVKWDAEVMFEATGVSAGIKVSSKAGTYKNNFNVFAQPTTTITLELTDAIFEGGVLAVGKTGKPQSSQRSVRTAQAGGDSVTLRNVQWSQPCLVIGILDVDGPVTVEDCQINTSLQAMSFSKVQGPITIKNNTLQSRLALYECADVVTVDGNTFASGSDAGPDIWLYRSRSLVQNNVMPNGLLVTGDGGYARATANQIGGNVAIGLGGLLRLEGNVLTGAMVADDFFGSAGLVNDPVSDNTGLSPDDASTPVDFDGNGCADYPPHNNERDSDGNCYYPGVSAPTDPGL
jgi:hypothetical protein